MNKKTTALCFRSFGFLAGICATQIVWSSESERSLRPPSADCMTNSKGNASRDGPGPGGNSIILRGWGGGKPRVSNSKPAFDPLRSGWKIVLFYSNPLLPNILPLVLSDSGFSFHTWSNSRSYYWVTISYLKWDKALFLGSWVNISSRRCR